MDENERSGDTLEPRKTPISPRAALDAFERLSPETQELLSQGSKASEVARRVARRQELPSKTSGPAAASALILNAILLGFFASVIASLVVIFATALLLPISWEIADAIIKYGLPVAAVMGGLSGGAFGVVDVLHNPERLRKKAFANAVGELLALEGPVGLTARLLQEAEGETKKAALQQTLADALTSAVEQKREQRELLASQETESLLSAVAQESESAERALRSPAAGFVLEGPRDQEPVQDELPGDARR